MILRLVFSDHQALKVRENKILGPYVDGLSHLVVTSFQVKSNVAPNNEKPFFFSPRKSKLFSSKEIIIEQ